MKVASQAVGLTNVALEQVNARMNECPLEGGGTVAQAWFFPKSPNASRLRCAYEGGWGLFRDWGYGMRCRFANMSNETERFAVASSDRMNLSARGFFRLLKVARTIADLRHSPNVEIEDLAEALRYRTIG